MEEIIALVDKQKKAKISWVSLITQTSVDDLIENAGQLGLVIEDDFIVIPTATKDQQSLDLYTKKREQAVMSIVENRTYRYNPGLATDMTAATLSSVASYFKSTRAGAFLGGTASVLQGIARTMKLRTVIFPFDGEMIDVKENDARPHLENFKANIRFQQDNFLRLYISVKKYFEFMVIPKHKHELTKDDIKMLLDRATQEDNRLLIAVQQMLQDRTVEMKTNRRGIVKELKIRMLDNTIRNIPPSQMRVQLFMILDSFLAELRRVFYEQVNLPKAVLQMNLD